MKQKRKWEMDEETQKDTNTRQRMQKKDNSPCNNQLKRTKRKENQKKGKKCLQKNKKQQIHQCLQKSRKQKNPQCLSH